MDTKKPKIVLSLGLDREKTAAALNLLNIPHKIVVGSFDGGMETSAVIPVKSIEDLSHDLTRRVIALGIDHKQDSIMLIDASDSAYNRNLKTGNEVHLGQIRNTPNQSVVTGQDYAFDPENKVYYYTEHTLTRDNPTVLLKRL